MAVYTIRTGFTIVQNGNVFSGGDNVDLNNDEFKIHKHKLEGIESTVEVLNFNFDNKPNYYPAPYISEIVPQEILKGSISKIVISGSFFTPETKVLIDETEAIEIEFINSHSLKASVIVDSEPGLKNVKVDNGAITTAEGGISVSTSIITLIDLRSGGSTLGQTAIKVREGMTWTRQRWGLETQGLQIWDAFVQLVGEGDRQIINRNTDSPPTFNFIYQMGTGLLGIGSTSAGATNSNQYAEQEFLLFFSDQRIFPLITGNDGTPGNFVFEEINPQIQFELDRVFRLEILNFAQPGSTFNIYALPSEPAGESNIDFVWQDIAIGSKTADWTGGELVYTHTVASNFTADAAELMPCLIPAPGQSREINLIGFYYS